MFPLHAEEPVWRKLPTFLVKLSLLAHLREQRNALEKLIVKLLIELRKLKPET